MTEEQNKLAEEIGGCPLCGEVPSGPYNNPFRNGEPCWYITHLCMERGVQFETRVQGKVPADAIKAWNNIAALREPATEAVLRHIEAVTKAEEVVFNAAIVADDRMRYEDAKNLRKLSDALKKVSADLSAALREPGDHDHPSPCRKL